MEAGGGLPDESTWKRTHCVWSVRSKGNTLGQRWWTTSFHTGGIRSCSGIRATGRAYVRVVTTGRRDARTAIQRTPTDCDCSDSNENQTRIKRVQLLPGAASHGKGHLSRRHYEQNTPAEPVYCAGVFHCGPATTFVNGEQWKPPPGAGYLFITEALPTTAAPSYAQKSVFKGGINPWKRLEGVPVGEYKKVGLTGQDAQKIVLLDGVGNHESSV